MNKKIFVIPLMAGALAFAGCSSHSSSNDRGGAATGRIDSGSSSSMPGDHNAVGTDTSDSTRSRGGSTSGSSGGSMSGSGSSSGSTSGGSTSGSGSRSSSGSTSGSGM